MANDVEVRYESSGQEIKLNPAIVRNYLTNGNEDVSQQEVMMFISLCKYQQLNPFLKEAYLVKFKGAPAQIITSKEAYMKRAFNSKNFDGIEAGIIVLRDSAIVELEGSFKLDSDKLLGGWAKVYVKDKKVPYTSKISIEEFSKGQSTWKSMPATMIRKTAMVQALREAFPETLGGLYIAEEQGVDETNSSIDLTKNSEIIEANFTEEVENITGNENGENDTVIDPEF